MDNTGEYDILLREKLLFVGDGGDNSMYIRVADALKLPSFQNAQVMAGSGGLDRKIYRISVVECPEFPIDLETTGSANQLFKDGDFFISSMYAIKDTPELFLDTVKLYYQFNTSGLILVRGYFQEIPQEVIDYANENNYPLIFLDKTIAYADVITDVMKAVFSQQSHSTSILVIDQILNGNYSDERLEKLANTLNHKFKDNLIVSYIQCLNQKMDKTNLIVSSLSVEENIFAVNYYNAILVFASYEGEIDTHLIKSLKKILFQTTSKYTTEYNIGISDVHKGLKNIKMGIEQAMVACRVSRIADSKIEYYDKIGSYKLLLEIKNKTVLRKFYNEFIVPIRQYDQGKKGELLNTMLCYARNDGNLKETAKELFQHENTIRYRLAKIKELVNAEDDNLRFSENLSIAYKVYKILSSEEG